ncbi:MAG TPA: hypothetical protein VF719_07620 [Abditibacteriaceae bacterium]
MNRLLLELQDADNLIAKIKRERSKLDDGSTLRSERDTLQEARDKAKKELSGVNARRVEKEDALLSAEEKITRQKGRLMTATSAHEVTALERDIKGLGNVRGELDEAILMLMDETETATGTLANLEKELQEKSAETAAVEKTFAAETARLEKELAAAVAARAATAAELDAPSLQKYTEFAARFHGVAVSHPEKGNCNACGMTLTPFNLKEARNETWPTCENCGRLMFVD